MKGKNLFLKRTVALLAAVGLTASLVTPLVSDAQILAKGNGVNIGTRTNGDADLEDAILDYKDYNNAAAFNAAVQKKINNYQDTITLFNLPENFNLNVKAKAKDWYPNIIFYVGGDSSNYKYFGELKYGNCDTVNITFPSAKEFYTTNDSFVNGLVVPGTKYYAFDYPKSFTDKNLENGYVYLSPSNLDFTYVGKNPILHTYTLKEGVVGSYGIDDSHNIYISLIDFGYKEFIANQYYDGTDGSSNDYAISTSDAIDSDYIEKVKEEIKKHPDATKFTYVAGDKQTEIPSELFEVFKSANKPFEIKSTTKDGVGYSFTFDKINEVKDFNPRLEVSKGKIEGVPAITMDFAHSGTLPGPMKVRVFVGTEYNSQTAYLYYKNADGKLEKQPSNAKVELGFAEFTIDHCSTYVVSTKEIPNAIEPTTPVKPEEPTTNPGGGNDNQIDKQPSKPADNAQDSNVNLSDKNTPDTGYYNTTIIFASLAAIAGAGFVVAAAMRKRAKN